ncbi:MAG: hypothetical protein DMF89_08670 [Acidobacteria bacterium]|nr:MAG: hypothetical protein DMF89_08670 [Acidobacteriota bacterium]
MVERRNVEATFAGKLSEEVRPIRCAPHRPLKRGNEDLALAGRHHVGERGQRLRIDERHGAPDQDERVRRVPFSGVARQAGEPQERQNVDVVPFERNREGEHVELVHRGLRLQRQQRRGRTEELGQLLLGRQEDPFADDVLLCVEEAVHRLEPEIGHPDPIRVREGQRHAQTIRVCLGDVPLLFRQDLLCPLNLRPGLQT